ncbi:glycerophosphodiester phosphodiesterase GDPDL3 [Rhodamnia argentea]|uniref:glycerophosphodiester phosphodiesterase n=1 Tax=Rhodamnia argentea TaxID=178133 RepID=A0ABM3GZW2_9MYRT|nr:glycerophosphodiester phosphodiesterase GDPDL3 [Rhodamnia argentea]
MCTSRAAVLLFSLLVSSAISALVSAQKSTTTPWRTLSGNPPLVIARGGFSGIFPDSSSAAYSLALMTSVPDVVLWCDVQLTKDGAGICAPDVKLENSTSIASLFKDMGKTYSVNGVPTQGWFSIDFTLNDLANLCTVIQGVYSRTSKFDGNLFPIFTVQDVVSQLKPRPRALWLNIQHDMFFTQHNLSMRSFVISTSRSVVIDYISSPEVGFLRSIAGRVSPTRTKLIFRFMGQDDIEPSIKQTYGSLLKNLTFIKTFASGILVPKVYIWPVDVNNYLQAHTSLVSDAHKAGLTVFAADFVNDVPLSYNYSFDPVAETLSYIDNDAFSVDGVLSDFPITPSAAIDCFAYPSKNSSGQAMPLVISLNGASGDYPGCTDLAYSQAISDGADIIDCPVQMSKDRIPFCLSSINLIGSSNVATTQFRDRMTTAPEIQSGPGIFSFSLNSSEIQQLRPVIASPFSQYKIFRNPANRNVGNFLSLSSFLTLAKNSSSISGVLINIENAAYLAKDQSLSITDAVLDALSKAGFNNQTGKKVMIKSTNSSVLMKIKENANYELVYEVDENIRDATNATVLDIKDFADSVVVKKTSVFPTNEAFLTGVTDVVTKLHAFKLPVYVQTFSNEFVSQAWDFFSDATVEVNSFVMGGEIDGVITDFPKTSASYKRNKCLALGSKIPAYMSPVQAGSLLEVIPRPVLPPAQAPYPVLTESDVAEPPLPAVQKALAPTATDGSTAEAPSQGKSGQPKLPAGILLSSVVMLLVTLFLL